MSINERLIESVVYRRLAPILLVSALLIAIVGAVGTYANSQAIARANAEAIASNEANAVTSCKNANETREASRKLWNFVLDLSMASNEDATPAEVAYMGEFREWVDAVYRERDCTDLSKKYVLPDPPEIPAA